MNPKFQEPTDVILVATGRNRIKNYLDQDFQKISSPINKCLISCSVAYIVSKADESTAQEYLDELIAEYEPSDFYLLSLDTLPLVTKQIVPETYVPREMLDDNVDVIQGIARIVNALAKDNVRVAFNIALLITWQRLRRVVLAGIYGSCLLTKEEQMAQDILSLLRKRL